jgi:hypothetical protein
MAHIKATYTMYSRLYKKYKFLDLRFTAQNSETTRFIGIYYFYVGKKINCFVLIFCRQYSTSLTTSSIFVGIFQKIKS